MCKTRKKKKRKESIDRQNRREQKKMKEEKKKREAIETKTTVALTIAIKNQECNDEYFRKQR